MEWMMQKRYGRKSQDDPLDSSVQGLVTPSTTKVNASGEEQVEDISPNTLEAAKTLSKVASLKPRSIDKGRRYKRRKEAKGKDGYLKLGLREEISMLDYESTSLKIKDKRRKAPKAHEETPKKSKETTSQEEA
ncbi:hypothetical protein Tco_0340273 [Tanacetum coccineum]